jgi:hypothetical protein
MTSLDVVLTLVVCFSIAMAAFGIGLVAFGNLYQLIATVVGAPYL